METVHWRASSHVRVSCTISSPLPSSMRAVWRCISKSTARLMALKLFMFFTSTLVPNASRPTGLTEMFTSHRMEPSEEVPVAHVQVSHQSSNLSPVRRNLSRRSPSGS